MTPKSLALSETDLQRAILAACNALSGVRLWRMQAGSPGRGRYTGGEPGVPDIIGYCGPYFLALEVKLPAAVNRKSKTATAQLEWRERAAADGASVYVVTSVQEAVGICRDINRGGKA